ncbi:MAG: hypothetical protein RJB01_290 [Actinomycetota bacterium]|jgi:exopolyphosphatase/guanosine-5'-triphosphate,3'-diphosphate pyrophosphatase
MGERFAAIDCGTNAIRLLIAEQEDGNWHDIVREMRTVRLGENIDATGEFSPAALQRTFDACSEYSEVLAHYPVAALRFVATSASRDARNRDEFFQGVERILHVLPEVITGDEEARLSYLGAIRGVPDLNGNVLVSDIGGGSTEFVVGHGEKVIAACSMDMGCVRMTERHLWSDPPTKEEITAAIHTIDDLLAQAERRVPVNAAEHFIGLAGSVTTVAAMALNLPAYQAERIHGAFISAAQVSEATSALLAMTRAERSALPFMHPGRVDVIGGGALILDRIVRSWGLPGVIAAETDILDGIVFSLAGDVT